MRLFPFNCNQLESCKGLCLDLLPKRCWLVPEDIEIIKKKFTRACGYAVGLSVDLFYFYTCNFDLELLIMQGVSMSCFEAKCSQR